MIYVSKSDIINICQKKEGGCMPRPQKSRRICCYPDFWSFAPDQDMANDTVVLSLDEFETIRQIDFYSKTQEQCAVEMNVARTTITAIYESARHKIATALIEGNMQLDGELFLFSGVNGRRCYPHGNYKLSCLENGKRVPDNFIHEQYLVINHENRHWLLSGCAHNGILNILDHYFKLFRNNPDFVISGFHMINKECEHTEEKTIILQTAQELSQMNTIFYSGHCTGIPAFVLMQEVMGDKLIALHSGEQII